MSQAYKEPPNYFGIRFCSMGCNDSQTQNEISGNQDGRLQMMQKVNEKQMKHQSNLNDSKESDMLDDLSEKLEDSAQKKDFVQPSLSQKNTLSSLKSTHKTGMGYNDTLKQNSYQNDLSAQQSLVYQQYQKPQFQKDPKPIARVLGYEYSENAESGDDEDVQKYHYENDNIVKKFEQRFQSDKNASLENKAAINQSEQNIYNANQFLQYFSETPQQDNLESTERFNAQNFSYGNMNNTSNKKDYQHQFISQDPSFKNLQEEQYISPRFTEDTVFYNNGQMHKILQQKIEQDLFLIDQIKNQNNQQIAFNQAQYQNASNLFQRNNPSQNQQHQQIQQQLYSEGQEIQDKYSQMMNGICITTKRSQQSNHDNNQDDQQILNNNNQINLNYPKQNSQRAENSLQNMKQSNSKLDNSHRNSSFDKNQLQYQENKNQFQHINYQNVSKYNQQKESEQFNLSKQGSQTYSIPQGYDANYNSNKSEQIDNLSQNQKIKQQDGDRPATIESSHGTEYTSYSQKQLTKASSNQNNINNNNNNQKLLMNAQPNPQNPLNSYLFINSAPLENLSQLNNLKDQEYSEDIKCNYSHSINEINPTDQEQQTKHYLLHQHDKKKKRGLVTDSHLFNSFNNTNFFQNQTIQNNSTLQNSHLYQSNQQLSGLQKSNQNRIVNLSTNSEVHEYSKSKTPINDIPVIQSNINTNNFTSYIAPQEQDSCINQSAEEQDSNRGSVNSNYTNQVCSIQNGQIDMSHIMKKVKDIQGLEQKDYIQNQLMLNSFNTQSIPIASLNNYASINQFASINQNNYTGTYDTARTISQVNLNSNHFVDAISSNQQLNHITTLTNSIDGRKKSENIFTPKNQKNGIISSNPNLQSQYTFKQSDTPDPFSKDLNGNQLLQSNQNQNIIQETDRALEQTLLDQTQTNKNNIALSLSPGDQSDLFIQNQQNVNLDTMRENTEEGGIPDDENKHQIIEGSIDIDPQYKLSPKVKSSTQQSNNQIFNENALKNLVNSIQQLSNHSLNPSKQAQEISQYYSNKDLNFTQNEKNQYASNSSRSTSPFNKPSLYLDKIEQISSPMLVDPSPKQSDLNSQSQLSMKANSVREEKSKYSGRQNSQNLSNTNYDLFQQIDKQKIEALLMKKDDEIEDNQKLIQIIQQTEQMQQQQLYSQRQEPMKKSENNQDIQDLNHEIEEKIFEHFNNKANQNSVQSNEKHYSNQYYNAQYPNQPQNFMVSNPSKQYENTPNFDNSIQSSQNTNQFSSKYNQHQVYIPPQDLKQQRSQEQEINQNKQRPYSQIQNSQQLHAQQMNQNQPQYIQQNNQNQYFLNPDYQAENQNSVINRDNSKNLSQASSIRLNKSLQQKFMENNQDWSQNNDGTIILTRDGLEFINFESTNDNQFFNQSKMQRELQHPQYSQFESNQQLSDQKNQQFQLQQQQNGFQDKQFQNQLNQEPEGKNFQKTSPTIQRKNRSPSPVQIKMTKSSELKFQVSQERIKQLNDKVQKKKDLISQREQEFQKKIEEKGQKQEHQVKEQNKQLRIQNLRLKEQNELLKKQMECIINVNQNVNTIQSSLNGYNSTSTNKQFDSAIASSRLNSTPLKSSQKSPIKNQKYSFKVKSPSLHQLNNSSYHSLNKSNGVQPSLPVLSIQMNLNSNQNTYQDLDNHQRNGQNIPVNLLLNQTKSAIKTSTPNNNNTFYVDISKTLQLTKKPSQDIIQKDQQSVRSNPSNIASNYDSQKSSTFDLNNQELPQMLYSPKNNYNFDSNKEQSEQSQIQSQRNQKIAQPLVHDDDLQTNHIHPQFHHMENENIIINNQIQNQNFNNLEIPNNQAIPIFSKVHQPAKLFDSYGGSNSLGDTNHFNNTKDTFQQNSPQNQLTVSSKHFRSQSTAAANQTKSSITSKPNNQLFDSKNSLAFEKCQPYLNESQKQSQNDIDLRANEIINRQNELNSNKQLQNNQFYSSKESQNGNYNTNNSRSLYNSHSTTSTARKLDSNKRSNADENKNKNEFILSAHLENQKNSQQGMKSSGGIREKVDQELKKQNVNGKYKLVQNIDNTYSLMQKSTKQPLQPSKISSIELTKNQYKNNFMPRQYNPEEFKKKNKNGFKNENLDQMQLNQQQIELKQLEQPEPSKEPIKQILKSQQEASQQNNQYQIVQENIYQSQQNDRFSVSTLQKKHSSPALTLPKTNSNLSIGLKSNRNIQQNTQAELSSNFLGQNMSNTSNNSKNQQQQSLNQLSKAYSQSQLNSQQNINSAQATFRQNAQQQSGDTSYLINNAMNSIFQKIENCYDNIQAGYYESVNALKKEAK